MSRPSVNLRPVADSYSGPTERIIEFSDRETGAGGLISIRRGDGELIVDVYRCDENVRVLARPTEDAGANLIGQPPA